ncbi:MAG: A/G-specific adenine glycosylase [Sodaliphilus sp.]
MTHPFASTLLRWYATHGRDLPWRHTADPYAIWLSEVILQQTRIEQGRQYWHRFMERFPDVASLAAASEDEVLRLWQGLGYYSRARNLHTAARQIVDMGEFPHTLEGIKQLKGVGDYTAAAIGSIAFGIPAAVVDGNVYRVLSRHFDIHTPINSTEGKKEFALLAQELLPEHQAAAYNQAIMDFGALQCTPKGADCPSCPLADSCRALHAHEVDTLPVKLKKLTIRTRRLQYVYIRFNGETAIHRRPAGDIWQGLWEPLLIEDAQIPPMEGSLTLLRQGVKHVLTHRILYADFYLLEAESRPALPPDFIWIPEAELDCYGLPRLVEMLVQEVKRR